MHLNRQPKYNYWIKNYIYVHIYKNNIWNNFVGCTPCNKESYTRKRSIIFFLKNFFRVQRWKLFFLGWTETLLVKYFLFTFLHIPLNKAYTSDHFSIWVYITCARMECIICSMECIIYSRMECIICSNNVKNPNANILQNF